MHGKPCVGVLTCGLSDSWAPRPEPWPSSAALAGDKVQSGVLGLATEGQPSDGLGPAAASEEPPWVITAIT